MRFWLPLLLSAIATARAQQLPIARLNTILPAAAQAGASAVVEVKGADLDDAKELHFSNAGIAAAPKDGTHFTVTVSSNVPPGLYEARVIGRFGATNPRAFVIGIEPQSANAGTNKSFATAQVITVNSAITGTSPQNAADYFKFEAKKGQRILIKTDATQMDSRMEPAMTLFDSNEKEIERTRTGLLDFTAPADGAFVLKLNDSQFRGGEEYWYRLAVSNGPWLDFALPAAIEPGSKSKVTLFGRNLPGAKPADFRIDGKPLDELEVEIEAPKEPGASLLSRLPAAAGADCFEYRFQNSNPILLSLATAKTILEGANNDRATNAVAVTPPCEIQGQFFPRRDVDWFQFEAAKGDVYWFEVFSQRLGLNTDPFLVIQRVAKDGSAADLQEAYDNDTNAGGMQFNTASRDPSARFEVKEPGTIRVQVRDLFGETITDPRRVYRLAIHKETPDFRLVAYYPAAPPLAKDSKEVHTGGAFLRRGDSTLIQVLALRKDGFAGDIELSSDNLPKGVTIPPTKLVNGANSVSLILEAAEDAPAWNGAVRIVGKARIGDKDISHVARAGSVIWNVADYQNEPIVSHLAQELFLTVSGAEPAPIALREDKPIDAVAGTKVNVPLNIIRRGEYKGAVKFTTLFEPKKEFEAAANATNVTFEVDLDKTKLPTGTNTLAVIATSPGRYRRITPDEAKAIEADVKKIKETLGGVTDAAKKDEANKQIKSLEGRLNAYQDLTATIYGTATIVVTPKK